MVKFINSVEAAGITPEGTIVIDAYGDPFQKNFLGDWNGMENHVATAEELFGLGTAPRPVIWSPGQYGVFYD